jgi:hypothetical protein
MAYPDNIDYYTAVARGLENHTVYHKFGRQTDLTTGAATTVWSGNVAYTYLSTASQLIIASDSATDATAGTGAITINIEGVDSNYALINEDIALSGFTAVTTTNSYLRIFRARVTESGSSSTNAGKIAALPDAAGNTFTAAGVPTTTSNVLAQIDTATAQTLMTQFTVPVTYTAYMTNYLISTGLANRTAESELYIRPFGETFQIKNSYAMDNTAFESSPKIPLRIEPKSDIEWRAKSSSTSGQISISYDLMLTQGD